MSVVLWLRLIRVPIVAWGSAVAFATAGTRTPVWISVVATLFGALMMTCTFRPEAEQPKWAVMKGARVGK